MKARAFLAVLSTTAVISASALPPTGNTLSVRQETEEKTPLEAQEKHETAPQGFPMNESPPDFSEQCPPQPQSDGEGKGLWTSIGAGELLDKFHREADHHGQSWLLAFEKHLFGSDYETKADGCGLIAGNCNPGRGWECRQYFEEGWRQNKPDLGPAYWIFEAVKSVQEAARIYDRELSTRTFITSLKLDSILDAFGANDVEERMPEWVAAAFGMISGGIGRIPGQGEHYGILSDVLTSTAEEPEDVAGNIEEQLVEVFEHKVNSLERHLQVVMGGGTPEETAALHGFNEFESGIANYFNVGIWIADTNKSSIPEEVKDKVRDIERKVASEAMKAGRWVLMINRMRDTDERCREHSPSARLIRGEDRKYFCAILYDGTRPGHMRPASTEFLETMDKHGISDLPKYYQAITDCYDNGDLEANLNLDKKDHNIARCYYSLPMWQVDREIRCGGPGYICNHDMTPLERVDHPQEEIELPGVGTVVGINGV